MIYNLLGSNLFFFFISLKKPSDHVGPRRTIELSAKEENYKTVKRKKKKTKKKKQ